MRRGSLNKKAIRQAVLKKRHALSNEIKRAYSAEIKKALFALKEFQEARNIMFFASFGSEVDTSAMITEALRAGKKVSLPRVKDDGLAIYEITGLEDLVTGYMGIPEPVAKAQRLRSLRDIDIVIMPGVAFDLEGNRLGYGKGYYDRMLSAGGNKPLLVALAFEEQVVEHIPAESHDIKVDAIVTEKRVIWIRKR